MCANVDIQSPTHSVRHSCIVPDFVVHAEVDKVTARALGPFQLYQLPSNLQEVWGNKVILL